MAVRRHHIKAMAGVKPFAPTDYMFCLGDVLVDVLIYARNAQAA